MSEPRLDRIAKEMARGVTRRRLARGLGAGLAGAVLAVNHHQEAAADGHELCLFTTRKECFACCAKQSPGKVRGQCRRGCAREFAPGQGLR